MKGRCLMKKLLVAMALLGVLTCKAVQFAPRIHSDLKNVTLNSSLQAGQNRNLLVGQVSQTSTRPRCKNVCSKFEVTAFSVPASTCPNGGAIAVGITGGTPPCQSKMKSSLFSKVINSFFAPQLPGWLASSYSPLWY